MQFFAAIPAMIANAVAPVSAGTLASAALTAPVGGSVTAGLLGGTTSAVAGTTAATGSALASGAVGAATPAGAAAAQSGVAAATSMLPSFGNVLGAGALAAFGGMSAYQGMAQEQALKAQADAEKRQTANTQMEYQNRLRQVLSMNTADAAARGVLPGGSLSAAQRSILEGGAMSLGQAEGDLRSKLMLYSAARRNALLSGFGGAGVSGLQMGSYLTGGRII